MVPIVTLPSIDPDFVGVQAHSNLYKDIVLIENPHRWHFGSRGRTGTVCIEGMAGDWALLAEVEDFRRSHLCDCR